MDSSERNVVLVTGATSGIGRAAALRFAQLGVRMVISGRDRARGEEVVDRCRTLGADDAVFVSGDITCVAHVDALIQAALDRFGRLDVAFNNAGYQEPRAPLAEQPDAVYDTVFDTNVRALVRAMRAEIRVMLTQEARGALRPGSGQPRPFDPSTGSGSPRAKSRGDRLRAPSGVEGAESRGVIVNNVSVSGIRNSNTGLALYSASKAAALSLTRSAALEYAPQGIRINAVSPGRIFTAMMERAQLADPRVIAATLPLRRLGEPDDVAGAVVWLASDAASFVVGHNLCVDGGFLSS